MTESIRKDAAELRGFVENVLDDVDSSERRTQLLGCVDRLEDLATRSTRSGIVPSAHIVKATEPDSVHCGRPTAKVNSASEEAVVASPQNPAWCQRCLKLYNFRAQKRTA